MPLVFLILLFNEFEYMVSMLFDKSNYMLSTNILIDCNSVQIPLCTVYEILLFQNRRL